MAAEIKCPFYRDTESIIMGRGLGYCELDFDRTVCDGNVRYCERPDALRGYLLEQKKKWGKNRERAVTEL